MKNICNFKLSLCLIALVLLVGFVNGCGSAQVRKDIKMNAWLGHNHNELIEALGPPTSIELDITGGKTLTYEFSSDNISSDNTVVTDGGESASNEKGEIKNRSYKNKPVMVCKFWVDNKGIIQKWHRSGSSEKDSDVINSGYFSNRPGRSGFGLAIEKNTKF